MTEQKKQQGFTIIEVVLVLAIAGLIFLMVFLALPALQRGQRDTGRKSDAGIVTAALNTYFSNNKSFTGITSAKFQPYLDKLGQYDVTSVNVTTTSPTTQYTAVISTVEIRIGAQCSASGATPDIQTFTAGTSRQAAVVTGLENNGSQVIAYCQNL